MPRRFLTINVVLFALLALLLPSSAHAQPSAFFEKHCHLCHDASVKKGGLDLTALKVEPADPENFARWLKIHDRIESGEMPPRKRPRPAASEVTAVTKWLHDQLVAAERTQAAGQGRTRLRRLTRVEYENTVRDLLDLPGISLQGDLPADGTAHGFDNNSEALDISHVNLARYLEAADRALDMAIATRPEPPKVVKQRISLANRHGFVAHVLLHGDAVLLKNKQPDPDFPPAGAHMHLDQGAHERMGSFNSGSSVGLFRVEDESFSPYFIEFVTIYPGPYRVSTSLWSFQWDKGKVLPARGTEAARLSVVTLTGDGRGGGHPSTVLGYYDAPSLQEKRHDFLTWMNPHDIIGFNAASLAPGANTRGKNRVLGFTGPGIACDYLDIEGPLYDAWPPRSHQQLFGDLPLIEFKPAEHPGIRAPRRRPDRQEMGAGINRPDPIKGIWTVASKEPLADADRLLARFLPRAFRRPVPAEIRKHYVDRVAQRLQAGDCFETALRGAYRAALCSPDFLYHVEPLTPTPLPGGERGALREPLTLEGQGRTPGKPLSPASGERGEGAALDDHALACRLSYFFWRSMPDDRLRKLADTGKLRSADTLHGEIERLLKDAKSQRFIEDFPGQWLKLRSIAATDPDRKLYPEFSAYLQDSMVGETRAYFRELIDKNLDASHLVKSNFAMLNEKLAVHYGIPGVKGSQIRRVELPADSPRGPFLTQAAILKITANGTTTSPVPRGAFVMDRLLGQPPEPPPPNLPAIEPDVRGAHTIREQLDKHRNAAACAACHVKMDPPGFALEAFDVIGGFRTRYRSIGAGEPAPRGSLDPFIGISFKLGPAVDASGELPDGRSFHDIKELQELLAADRQRLLKNLARQFTVYGTGRDLSFGDREAIADLAASTHRQGGGIRTLLHELIQSRLFQTR